MALHSAGLPGESEEYRTARDRLLEAELELRRQTEAVAAQRRALPLGGVVPVDYRFDEWDAAAGAARAVPLSELFQDGQETLFLYSFMWVPRSQGGSFIGPCPSCTSIIDGLDGAVPHIAQRISFAVAAKAPIEQFNAHAQSRGWRHARLLSTQPSTYNVDYQAEDADGNQLPVATVFVRRDGEIRHFWSSEVFRAPRAKPTQGPRHVDFMWRPGRSSTPPARDGARSGNHVWPTPVTTADVNPSRGIGYRGTPPVAASAASWRIDVRITSLCV